MTDIIRLEQAGAVATLTLNRPDALNALNSAMAEGLAEATEAVQKDDGVRCLVIRGAGDGFMAGGDLKQFHRLVTQGGAGDVAPIDFDVVHRAIRAIRTMAKPVLASVHGPVAGFGVSLMSACDLAIAADDSFFTLAYCLIGTSPDGGSTYHLPRTVGLKRAMEMALLGDRFDAAKALEIGLINRVVATDQQAAETDKLAARLAQGPTYALGRTKLLLNETFLNPLADQLDAEARAFADCARSDDFIEGITAFLEKRSAKFTGR